VTNSSASPLRPRLAAIDIGANSMRLVVAEVDADRTYRILDEEREMTRLGEGLEASGRLREAAMERSLATLGKMKAIADGFQVSELRTVATSAVREATNGRAFVREAWRRHRLRIDVIPAEEEARLAFQSAARHFKLERRSTAIVDIGGGSVEVVLAAGTVLDEIYSLKLGAVRVTERHVRSDPLKRRHWKEMRRAIDRALATSIGRPPFNAEMMIGSGGTFTTIGEMVQAQREGRTGNVHGYAIRRADLKGLVKRLRASPLEARRQMPGLSPARADIILAGATVIARLAKRLDSRKIIINERGIREGLLLSMIADLPEAAAPAEPAPEDRMHWVRVFARKCRSNERHCEHVSALALQLFDGLSGPYALPVAGRDILQAAALLHDIGYLIHHAKHHKHAYHLIMHGELPGFSPREVHMIANVARYQRRAFPKKSHATLAGLDKADRRLVAQLGGLLRISDGLDRAHTQAVQRVRLHVREDNVRVLVDASAQPQVEIWDAQRKAELFERAFGTKLRLAWARSMTARVTKLTRRGVTLRPGRRTRART
jgi:exopolyphosphatase/guanosine-5'-triphosphate,3'-diphosphate pyrophosphatase